MTFEDIIDGKRFRLIIRNTSQFISELKIYQIEVLGDAQFSLSSVDYFNISNLIYEDDSPVHILREGQGHIECAIDFKPFLVGRYNGVFNILSNLGLYQVTLLGEASMDLANFTIMNNINLVKIKIIDKTLIEDIEIIN
jgi:hypothetical protein